MNECSDDFITNANSQRDALGGVRFANPLTITPEMTYPMFVGDIFLGTINIETSEIVFSEEILKSLSKQLSEYEKGETE